MSIQPLFSGPLFLPSSQLVSASTTGSVPTADNNIDGGQNVGNILDKHDSDFKGPRSIQRITTEFTNSISPTTSDTLLVRLGVDPDPFGNNPDSVDILNATLESIRLIKSPTIGVGVGPRANSDPLTWRNPSPLDILVGITSSTGGIVNAPNGIVVTPNSIITNTPNGIVVSTPGNTDPNAVPLNPTPILVSANANSATSTGGTVSSSNASSGSSGSASSGGAGSSNNTMPNVISILPGFTYIPINILNLGSPVISNPIFNNNIQQNNLQQNTMNFLNTPIWQQNQYMNTMPNFNVSFLPSSYWQSNMSSNINQSSRQSSYSQNPWMQSYQVYQPSQSYQSNQANSSYQQAYPSYQPYQMIYEQASFSPNQLAYTRQSLSGASLYPQLYSNV